MSHTLNTGMVGRPQRWLVCAALAGGKPLQLAAQARRDESRGLVPWVGAAAPLPELPASAASSSARRPSAGLAKEERGSGKAMPLADDSTANSTAAGGRAFVFLPLPIATGLPLHVNGCFELSRWEALAPSSACSSLCYLPSVILVLVFRTLKPSWRTTPVNPPQWLLQQPAGAVAGHRYGRRRCAPRCLEPGTAAGWRGGGIRSDAAAGG